MVVPNIPTITPPDQRASNVSLDMLREVCACMCMNRTTREPVTLSTYHPTPFSALNTTAESRQSRNPYWLERPRFREDHADVPTAGDFNSAGNKPDGKAGETSS